MPLQTKERERAPLLNGTPTGNRLTRGRRAAFGVGHVLNDICAALWFSYTLLYLQVVLGMKPILAGVLLMIGQVADATATPVVGIISDRFGTKKLWYLAGTGLVIVSFPMVFAACPHCGALMDLANSTTVMPRAINDDLATNWLAITYYVILIIIFQIGWAIVQIIHLSLITDLTPSQHERAGLTAIRYTATVCSSITVYIITWCIFHATRVSDEANKIGPGDSYKFIEIVFIGIAIGLACSVWFHFGLRTSSYSSLRPSTTAITVATPGGKERWSVISYFRSPLLLQVAFLYVASRMYLTISLVYIPLFLDESLDGEGEALASVPLVSYISSFIGSLGIKYFNNRFGSKVSNMLGGIISLSGCIWIAYGLGHDYVTNEIYAVAVLLGAGSSITLVTSLCITADLIGMETESGAFVYSAVTFSDKLFTGIAVVIIEYLKCSSKSICPRYYRDVLAYVCGGSALFGLLILVTLARIPLGNKAKDDLSFANGLQPELLTSIDKPSAAISNGLMHDTDNS